MTVWSRGPAEERGWGSHGEGLYLPYYLLTYPGRGGKETVIPKGEPSQGLPNIPRP